MSELTCPKCHGSMRQYERNGVHVDQCSDCRGIFLDRGELERLTEAEGQWASQQSNQPQQARQEQSSYERSHQQQSYSKPKKKSSFLSELFEG